MTNDSEKIKILGRIRKMLALANNEGASEGERDNALRMAHATLAKYNLDMAEVESSGKPQQEARAIVKKQYYGRPWARIASQAIADMCFCFYLITPAKRANQCVNWFIGRESNATSAAELAEWVVNSIWREAAKRANALGYGNEYARNFATAATTTVAARCAALKKAATSTSTEGAPGTALVLASHYQLELQKNREHLEASKITVNTMKTRMKDLRNSHALNAGTEYGKSINLNRQVTGDTVRKLT